MKYLGIYTGDDLYANIRDKEPVIRHNSFIHYENDINGLSIAVYPLDSHNGWYGVKYVSLDKVKTVSRMLKYGEQIRFRSNHLFDGKECVIEQLDVKCLRSDSSTEGKEIPTYLRLREMYTDRHVASYIGSEILHILDVAQNVHHDGYFKKPAISIRDFWPTDILTEEGKKKFYDFSPDSSVVPDAINKEIKKAQQAAMAYCTNDVIATEVFYKYMEERMMTATDKFLKCLDGITITSTRAYIKIDGLDNSKDIYYPEINITPEIAEELVIILMDMVNSDAQKVVFNPKEGYTQLEKYPSAKIVTVKCHNEEFGFIKGYTMAKSKYIRGEDDYNWLNKIMNHRKVHIEYTEPEKPKKPIEPKAKKTSKKGGKK